LNGIPWSSQWPVSWSKSGEKAAIGKPVWPWFVFNQGLFLPWPCRHPHRKANFIMMKSHAHASHGHIAQWSEGLDLAGQIHRSQPRGYDQLPHTYDMLSLFFLPLPFLRGLADPPMEKSHTMLDLTSTVGSDERLVPQHGRLGPRTATGQVHQGQL
jgi:hypothetical protein